MQTYYEEVAWASMAAAIVIVSIGYYLAWYVYHSFWVAFWSFIAFMIIGYGGTLLYALLNQKVCEKEIEEINKVHNMVEWIE